MQFRVLLAGLCCDLRCRGFRDNFRGFLFPLFALDGRRGWFRGSSSKIAWSSESAGGGSLSIHPQPILDHPNPTSISAVAITVNKQKSLHLHISLAPLDEKIETTPYRQRSLDIPFPTSTSGLGWAWSAFTLSQWPKSRALLISSLCLTRIFIQHAANHDTPEHRSRSYRPAFLCSSFEAYWKQSADVISRPRASSAHLGHQSLRSRLCWYLSGYR